MYVLFIGAVYVFVACMFKLPDDTRCAEMQVLDGDGGLLRSGENIARRDIVQFVP